MPVKPALTQGPVWRRLSELAVPMVFGIVAVLSISLADTYFVGKLGTEPLAALSFTFPVTMAIASLSIGLGAGAASVLSRAVGADQSSQSKRLSTDALLLAVLVVGVVSGLGYFTIRPLFSLLGAEGNTLNLIERYMQIWYISMPFLVIPMVANALIRAVGDAFWPSLIMIGAAIVNIGITPVLVFGWWVFPAMNIEGAAWGTFFARAMTLVFALYIVIWREHLVTFRPPPLAELWASWRQVVSVGVPAAAGNMVNPIGVGVVTALLATYGTTTVAAFGIATRVEAFAAIPMLALSAAIGPVAGQNWGAQQPERIIQALRQSFGFCLVWSVLLALGLFAAAPWVAAIFSDEPAVIDTASLYLRIVPLSLWGYGMIIIAAAAYNSLGKAMTGLGYYLTRTAVLYVPLSWMATLWFESTAVFVAIAIANAVAGLACARWSLNWLRQAECGSSQARQDPPVDQVG